jgi:hypothetical protein
MMVNDFETRNGRNTLTAESQHLRRHTKFKKLVVKGRKPNQK